MTDIVNRYFPHVAGAGVIPLRIAPEKMLVFF